MPAGVDSYRSAPLGKHDKRELTRAGQLEPESWRQSAKALDQFLARSYSTKETEQALVDAVSARRFAAAAMPGQRTTLLLYFAVSRLMKRHGLGQLPWSQSELDRWVHNWSQEPSIRELKVDFPTAVHKLYKNGAFDHLAGLTATIISVQYLPGVRKLMLTSGQHAPPPPSVSRNRSGGPRSGESTPRAAENGDPRNAAHSRADGPPVNAPKAPRDQVRGESGPSAAGSSRDAQKSSTDSSRDIVKEPTMAATTTSPPPVPVTTNTAAQAAQTLELGPVPSVPVIPQAVIGISASSAIIQEGIEALSEPNMMPFVHQYELLNDVLRMLERSCFFWGQKTIPEVLKKKKWTAWQKVELLDWLEFFAAADTSIDIPEIAKSKLMDDTIPGLKQMRNASIRRKDLPVGTVATMMKHARDLVKLLQDETCIDILTTITVRLLSIDNHSEETRLRLKADFKRATADIADKYVKLFEDEIKEKSAATSAQLEGVLESCDWNFKFDAPDDSHYAEKTAGKPPVNGTDLSHNSASDLRANTAIHPTATVRDIAETPQANTVRPFISHQRTTSASARPVTPADSANEDIIGESEYETASAHQWSMAGDPPPRGTQEYEQYWLVYKNHNKNGPQVALVSDALGLEKPAWEALRQDATHIIETQGLLDIQLKETKAKGVLAQHAFKLKHHDLFKDIKLQAFADLLCELTFHSARRGINERGRRRAARQKANEEDAAYSPTARESTVRDNTTSRDREAAARRQAKLDEQVSRLEALKASTSAANRQPHAAAADPARPFRVQADDWLAGLKASQIPASTSDPARKRSRSPSDDRYVDAAKKVKIEPSSQEDILAPRVPQPQPQPTTPAGFGFGPGRANIAPMQYNLTGGIGTRMSSLESGEVRESPAQGASLVDNTFSANTDYVSFA